MLGKLRLLFWIGIVLVFVPFFGIPDTWKTVLMIGLGGTTMYTVVRLRYIYKKMKFDARQGAPTQNETTVIHG
ncbi:MAG: hypothetical protein KBB91_00535 [Candidatus Pacebacteria bacterium]|jgi:hypothetical protein|nr:hypothetical protein [Candidatus Paceibacterota bacterium]MBP9700842.1 hypothetical protein [Candidatus Paceibacterota bacterium]